ncbi:hypothetical protein D3C75_885820 [compost metagenome]
MRAGAGDDEHQRRRAGLAGQAVFQRLYRPEVVRQFATWAQAQAVVGLIDVGIVRQAGAQFRRGGSDGRLERIGQREAVACGVDLVDRRLGAAQPEGGEEREEA